MERKSFAAFIPSGIAFATWMAVSAATTLAARFPEPLPSDPAAPPARSAEGPHALAAFFSPQVLAWETEILRWSSGFGLDPDLVATVMQIESCGDRNAVSRSGAQGLFQVMPFHFSAGEDMRNPDVNARRGLAYLAESLLKSEGDVGRALAGYNGGHGVIGWEESLWPAETRRYVYWGGGIYTDAAAGRALSLRLEEWLAAGGYSLCGEAAR
jgi:soluble lytic murein transglycosylase-like protein